MTLGIRLLSIRCNSEDNESSASEEVYVIVTAVNFRKTLPGLPSVHNVRVNLYGVWENFDAGEMVNAIQRDGPPIWGLNGTPADIANLDEVAFFVTLMENDNGDANQYRVLVEAVASASLGGTIGEQNNAFRASRLLESIQNALNGVDLPFPFVLDDDHIGTEPLPLTPQDLIQTGFVDKLMRIKSSEGDYNLMFRLTGSPFTIFGSIRDRWEAVGAEASPLGVPLSNEEPTFDSQGRAQLFGGGLISWHPATDAHIVWGAIRSRWLELGREAFGYPTTDELSTADGRGRFNVFRALQFPEKPEATIIWSPETGAHEIWGGFRAKWAELGHEGGRLGYPVSGDIEAVGGRQQLFQNGLLFWNESVGVVVGNR